MESATFPILTSMRLVFLAVSALSALPRPGGRHSLRLELRLQL